MGFTEWLIENINLQQYLMLFMHVLVAFMLGAIVAWASYLDILAFILGVAGFIAGYFAGQEIETQPNK